MKHHPTKNLIQGLAFSLLASLGSASPAIAEDGIEVFGPLDGSFGDIQGRNIIDLDGDGQVAGSDLGILFVNWSCP